MGASVRCGGRGGLGAKFERGPLAPADNELGGAAGQDAMEPRSLPHRAGYEPQELGSMECEWRVAGGVARIRASLEKGDAGAAGAGGPRGGALRRSHC